MDWLEQIALMRSINRSNVILVETDDPKRYQQLMGAVQRDFLKKGNKTYKNVYEVSIQLREINNLRGTPIEARGTLTQTLAKKLREDPSLIILAWVITRAHADSLLDFLVAVSQHPQVYVPRSELASGKPPYLPSTVIVLTHSLELFPTNARKMFAEVTVSPSTEEERNTIIHTLAEEAYRMFKRKITITPDAVNASAGLTLHEIETACLESIKLRQTINAETFRKYKIELLKQYGLEYIEPKHGFEAVGGYDLVKTFLRNRIVLFYRNPEIVKKYGLRPPRGVLFFGPPGTGKSWLARALAREMNLPMISLNASDLLRGIVGESEQRTRKIIQILESMAPVVVFIDEADQLFQSRGQVLSTDSGVFRRVQNLLLDWLGREERKCFVIMATNYLEQFDFAAIRAGRIDYAIPIMLPDREARKQILVLHTKVLTTPQVRVDVDFEAIARATEGFTGAELRQVVETAKIYAAEEQAMSITNEHFEKALETIRIDIEARKRLVARMLEQANKLETVIVPRELLESAQFITEEREVSRLW